MQSVICPTCGYEFETPVPGPAGPGCPRCEAPAAVPAGGWPVVVRAADYLSAALAGAALGLLAAAFLFLSRS